MSSVFTVGLSNHSLDEFTGMLLAWSITDVCDVRSAPWSRYSPQFNKDTIALALRQAGITYRFYGGTLGARPADPALIRDGRVSWDALRATEGFRKGIEEIAALGTTARPSLLCAERDPAECHRTVLVARALVEQGSEIVHILPGPRGERHHETHASVMDRLARSFHLEAGLFMTSDSVLEETYRLQEEKIAYRPAAGSERP